MRNKHKKQLSVKDWYEQWHKNPRYPVVHWAVFIVIIFIVVTQLLGVIQKYYDISFITSRAQTEYFVATNGSVGGDGSINNPWDLKTALKGANGIIKPGSIVNLRGGTYSGRFESKLTGNSSYPIIVRSYPLEWAKIDGNYTVNLSQSLSTALPYTTQTTTISDTSNLESAATVLVDAEEIQIGDTPTGNSVLVNRGWNGTCGGTTCPTHSAGAAVKLKGTVLKITGAYTWYQGLEIANSYPNRTSRISGSNMQTDIVTGSGIDDYGIGNKIINSVIHDHNGQGIGSWSQAYNSEYYGNVVYNNGLIAPDRPHGHGLYAQNETGSKTFANNIILHNFDLMLQQYGSSISHSDNFYWDGNTFYSPGGDGVLFGGNAPMNNLNITNNNFFGVSPRLGYGNPYNDGVNISGNYLGRAGLSLSLSRNVKVTDNTIYNPGNNNYNVGMTLNALPSNVISDYVFDNNTYYGVNGSGVGADLLVYPDTVSPTRCPYYWFNHSVSGFGYCGAQQGWQEDLGYDLHSTRLLTPPTSSKVILQPNKYDNSRVNLIIYNWSNSATITANISSLNWVSGDTYELHNTLDYFGDVIKATYDGGGSITVPMTNHTLALPVGFSTGLGVNTFPEFGAFVLVRNMPPPPTPTPTPTPMPTPPPPPATGLKIDTFSASLKDSSHALIKVSGSDQVSFLKKVEFWQATYNPTNCSDTDKSGCVWSMKKSINAPKNSHTWSTSASIGVKKQNTYWYGAHLYNLAGNMVVEPAPAKLVVP